MAATNPASSAPAGVDFDQPGVPLRLLANNLPAFIAYFEIDNMRCRFANQAYANTFGFDEQTVVGKSVLEIIGAEAFAIIAPYIEQARKGQSVRYERPIPRPEGGVRTMEVSIVPHLDANGVPFAAYVLITDISKHRNAENAVRESEERLQKFVDATEDGIVFHERGTSVDANQAMARMARTSLENIIGRSVLDFVAPESRETVTNHIKSGFEQPYEGLLLRADGSKLVVEFIGKVILVKGKPQRMTVVRDISERKEAEARIQFLAHHDTLTHLPNRALLMDRLQMLVAAARRNTAQLGVMFIDLDNFKTINDSLGHYAGDELLRRVASRLQSCVRAADVVGRLAGDEFLVVITEVADPSDLAPVAEKIAAAVSEPFSVDQQVLAVSASIGISVFPRDGENPESLIRSADAAMYLAKDRGRNNFQFFLPDLNRKAFQALSMESGIRKAIKQLEFTLHYQPVVHAGSGDAATAEALIRWKHPELGLLGPDQFIPVAEHRGLITQIGKWVIAEAVRQAREWMDRGIHLPIAINVSAVQFKQRDLVEALAAALATHGVPGSLIELELTESLFLEDVTAMTRVLQELKALGVTLTVDDFGTGYSSLAYLKRYPIDKVKIDRSFIRDIPGDADDTAITLAIIGLADSLKLAVVAEGVETDEQAAFLTTHRCDYLQGYLISRPLPPDDFAEWLVRRGPVNPKNS